MSEGKASKSEWAYLWHRRSSATGHSLVQTRVSSDLRVSRYREHSFERLLSDSSASLSHADRSNVTEARGAGRSSREFREALFFSAHARVWLLFLLVNPAGHKQADYLFIDVWRSAYPHRIYANSFANPLFLTGSAFPPPVRVLINLLFRLVSAHL